MINVKRVRYTPHPYAIIGQKRIIIDMKSRWKQYIKTGIMVLMVLGMAGCKGTVPEKEEEILHLSVSTDGEQPAADNKIYQKIKEELHVEFEFVTYTGDGDKERKAMAASGDYTDILDASELVIDRGGVIPLEDMLSDYPNLYQHYEPYLDLMTEDDGHIYILPDYGITQGEVQVKENWRSGFFIQKAVLSEYGYPRITTLDEYFDLIELYMRDHPEIDGKKTVGYTICNDGTSNYGLLNPPALLAGYPNNANCIVDPETNIASDFRMDDISKRFYRKLCEEYEKGVIDPEACIISHEQYIDRLSQGNVLGFADETWNINDANTYLGKKGMNERTYVSIPLVYEEGIREQYLDYNSISMTSGFMISEDCESPEKVLELFDTLLEEKWQKLLSWGIEGEEYLVDEEGMFYRTQDMRVEQYKKDWAYRNSAETLYNHLPKIEGRYSDGNAATIGSQLREFQETLTDYDRTFLENYHMTCWGDFFQDPQQQPAYFPTWRFVPTDGTKAEVGSSKASECNTDWLPRVITCRTENFEEMWRQYCEAYKKTGYEDFIQYINECIQESLS